MTSAGSSATLQFARAEEFQFYPIPLIDPRRPLTSVFELIQATPDMPDIASKSKGLLVTTFGEQRNEVMCDRGGWWCRRDNTPRTTGSQDADVVKCKLDLHCDQRVFVLNLWIFELLAPRVHIVGAPNCLTETDVHVTTLALRLFFSTFPVEMSLFKKFTKSRRPSKQPLSLGIPTQIAVGPLGVDADLDPGVGSGGWFRSV